MRKSDLKLTADNSSPFFLKERKRLAGRNYADIISKIGEVASRDGHHIVAKILDEAEISLRRMAAGLSIKDASRIGEEESLYRLCYLSFARRDRGDDLYAEATAISRLSSVRNRQDGITGTLSVCDGWFVQVLEGARDRLLRLFDRILRDCRHEDVRALDFGPIAERQFGAWSMAFSGAVAPELVRKALAGGAQRGPRAERYPSKSVVALATAMAERLAVPRAAAD